MLASLVVFAATAADAAQQSGGLPQLHVPHFSPQLVWLAITFAALYFILSRFSLPRIAEVIEERRDRIQRDLDEAARLKTETEKALAAYEQELAAARNRAGTIARETRDKLSSEVDSERARVDAQVNAKLADAEKRITDMKSKALTQVNVIASDTASAVVTQLIGADVTADEARRALEPAAGE